MLFSWFRGSVRNLSSYVRLSTCTYCTYGYIRAHITRNARTARTVFSDVQFPTYTYSFPDVHFSLLNNFKNR